MFRLIVVAGIYLWLSTALGCGPPAPTLAKQVERVRRGESDTIQVFDRVITDNDLAVLDGLAELRVLELKTKLTDAGTRHLAGLSSLERLRLDGAAIGDPGLRAITQLQKLQVLNLPDAQFGDEGLAQISQLPELFLLRFGSPRVSDEGLAHIASMPELRFLHLIGVPVTDQGLKHLHEMHQLESFYLDGGNVTDDGLTELLKALPELHFHKDQQHLPSDANADDHDG